MFSNENFFIVTNIQLRFMEQFRFMGIINNTCTVYSKNLDMPAVDITVFFEGIKKGSKKYRLIMDSCDKRVGELTATICRQYWSNGPFGAEYAVNSYEREKFFYKRGTTYSFLYNEIRDFGFKFVYNLLKLNAAWARIKN